MTGIPAIDPRSSSRIASYVLTGGVVATIAYRAVGFECPMRSVGLACPGCGCGRATVALLRSGPVQAFREQPTALLFLLSLMALAFLGRLAWVQREKWRSNLVVLLPIHLALLNLVFQLNRAVIN
jgi:hypothetical protein